MYELHQNVWKPKLKICLSKLPNISRLSLDQFCDDDSLCIIAHQCYNIKYLKIKLGVESYSEQQLGDDGFSELVECQVLN